MYTWKSIDSKYKSTETQVVRSTQKLYLGHNTNLTESFNIVNVISGSEEPHLSSSYYDSLNMNFYLSGSKRFAHKFGSNSVDAKTRLRNPWFSYLMFDSWRHKFHESSSIISISQKHFGEGIVSGTFTYINKSHPSGTIKIIDDGNGNLYAPTADISKSNSSALSSSQNYIGNISYNTGVVIVTQTGSFSHPTPSTGSIKINTKVTGTNFFSVTGSNGKDVKFICQNFGTNTSGVRYFVSCSNLADTAASGTKAINDFFDGEHISASSIGNVITMSNDSNLLKSRMPSYRYAFQDNYPPMSGSYGHITASGFGGGQTPILYNHIGLEGPTTYGASDHYLTFKSQIKIFHHEYSCVLNPGEFNSTLNPTVLGYLATGSDGSIPSGSRLGERHLNNKLANKFTGSHWSPYATTIALYSDNKKGILQDLKPVVVGRFSKPIKTNRKVPIIIKIKFDT